MEIPKECYSCKDEEGELLKCDCRCVDLYIHLECLKRFNICRERTGDAAITCVQCNTLYGNHLRSLLAPTTIPPLMVIPSTQVNIDRDPDRKCMIMFYSTQYFAILGVVLFALIYFRESLKENIPFTVVLIIVLSIAFIVMFVVRVLSPCYGWGIEECCWDL
jgi:hypothetical protein